MRALFVGLAVTACTPVTNDFVCAVDADCMTSTGTEGRCEFNHRCSYADPSCASGSRFGGFAGNASNECTAAGCTGQVRSGRNNTCLLTGGGQVFCWGDDSLAASKVTFAAKPEQIDNGGAGLCARYGGTVHCASGDTSVSTSDIAVGSDHVCAISSNAVTCWGKNDRGQLGNGNTSPITTPVTVGTISAITQLASGVQTSCAIDASTQLWCWGDDSKGEVGRGAAPGVTLSADPQKVTDGANPMDEAVQVAVGNQFACSAMRDGTVSCWGHSDTYQCGQRWIDVPFFPDLKEFDFAVQVPGLTGIVQVTAGAGHACALDEHGEVWCWGANPSHEAAAATVDPITKPTLVVDQDGHAVTFSDIDAGDHHTCGRGSDGTVLCWGANAMGQLGNGTKDAARYPTAITVSCE